MRLVELLQVTGAVVGALAAGFAAGEQLLARRFRSRKALSREAAIELPALRPLARWRLERLRSAGAVIVGADGRAYLDESVYRSLRKRRAALGVGAVALVMTLVVALYLLLEPRY